MPPKPQPCIYCGVQPGSTRDHVVPLALFDNREKPQNLPTVKSCVECNREKGESDVQLWEALCCSREFHESKRERPGLHERLFRSVRRGSSKIAPFMLQAKSVELTTPSGIYLGTAKRVPLPDDFVRKGVWWVARGLFAREWSLDPTSQRRVEVERMSDDDLLKTAAESWPSRVPWSSHDLGDVFSGITYCSADSAYGLAYLAFYERIYFKARLPPPDHYSLKT